MLLRGPSGCGKSDLALRLIDGGAELVADDYVELTRRGASVVASTPAPIAGLLEVRGVGLLTLPCRRRAELRLAVDIVAPDTVVRLPKPDEDLYEGVAVARLRLAAFEASTPAKIRLAMDTAAREPGEIRHEAP